MTWRPWGPMVNQGATSAPELSEPAMESAPPAEPSSETWSPDFNSLPMWEQILEIHDHVCNMVATMATMRAETQEFMERIEKALGVDLPPYFRDRGQTDMTGSKG